MTKKVEAYMVCVKKSGALVFAHPSEKFCESSKLRDEKVVPCTITFELGGDGDERL